MFSGKIWENLHLLIQQFLKDKNVSTYLHLRKQIFLLWIKTIVNQVVSWSMPKKKTTTNGKPLFESC